MSAPPEHPAGQVAIPAEVRLKLTAFIHATALEAGLTDRQVIAALAEAEPEHPAEQMAEMIVREIWDMTGGTITADWADRIGRELLDRRETPPEHPVQWVRALLRAEPNPRKFLPTPAPPKFTAPPPVAPAKAESIEAAKAAIAHLKRAPSAAGDPLRDLAQQQLAELRDARKKTEAA